MMIVTGVLLLICGLFLGVLISYLARSYRQRRFWEKQRELSMRSWGRLVEADRKLQEAMPEGSYFVPIKGDDGSVGSTLRLVRPDDADYGTHGKPQVKSQ